MKSTPSEKPPFPWATVALFSLLCAGLSSMFTWNLLSQKRQSAPTPVTTAATQVVPTPPPMVQDSVSLGNWYYDRQQWTNAIAAYEQAIAGGTDNPDVRTDLGNSYRFIGQPQKALEEYQIAQRQDPQHENSLLNQASLYSQVLHNPAKAAEAAREFLQRFPNSVSADAARQLLLDPAQAQTMAAPAATP
ncbi:MAG: tetratricopeptide repeat protein [Chthoniobacteraceae bacterium]